MSEIKGVEIEPVINVKVELLNKQIKRLHLSGLNLHQLFMEILLHFIVQIFKFLIRGCYWNLKIENKILDLPLS